MSAELQKKLEPAAFVRTVLTCAKAEFVNAWGEQTLLVQIDDLRGPLVTTLRSGLSGPLPSAALRRVAVHTIADVGAGAGGTEDTWPESLIVHQLRGRLARCVHFAVAVQRRANSPDPHEDRVFIGRGRDNDILLVDESVSKRHAWLRRGDSGRWVLTDSGSRNGTQLNGKAIAAQRPAAVGAGDILGFGKIEAMFCPTEAVWEALRRD